MIPVSYALSGDEAIYQGDTYRGPLITLPDLSSVGGPADLTGSAIVTAQISVDGTLVGSFDVVVEDAAARQVRPTMAPVDTAQLPVTQTGVVDAWWDLQVKEGTWIGTILKGKIKVLEQVTR